MPGHHEHAASCLSQAHSGTRNCRRWRLVTQTQACGRISTADDDARKSGSAGIPPARSAQELLAGGFADKLQSRPLRSRGADDATQKSRRRNRAARFDPGDGPIEIPVKLKVHDSIFVPLAKWPMLMAGNYRCIRRDEMIPIKEAVHGNVDGSRAVYDWVVETLRRASAPWREDWCRSTSTPKPPKDWANRHLRRGRCSAVRNTIERVDCLVRRIARQQGTAIGNAGRDRHVGRRATRNESGRALTAVGGRLSANG